MKKQYFSLLFIIASLACANSSFAQLVGGNCYLKGAWLEIGLCPNGGLGTTPPPVGYHTHCAGCFPTNGLAEVYDYGHDGWTVGTPPMMGDYTLPGSPFEGWEVQANGSRAQAYATGSTFNYSGAGTMTGGLMSVYTNAGGRITGTQTGTYNPGGATLVIKQETRVDTFASCVIFTTKFYNQGVAPITGVYYWRSCDPDNDQTWPGGTFTTNNVINYQNDVIHRVEVTATGQSSTLPPLSLCTKDCRAVAVIYGSWGLTVSQDLAAVWNQTYGGGGAFYNVGVNHPGDIGIGIVFNIGTIPAGDSDVVSCAYVFNGVAGIDDAFPEPGLTVPGSTALPPTPYPGVVVDTYNACLNPGLTAVPVDLLYSEDKSWSWGKWTWSPGTGLSSTTGSHVTVITTVLPPVITYTITGVDSATCQYRTMLLTFITCNNVRANSPCYGDSLFLRRIGDSTGCTYYWYGPGGYTSTQQNPIIFPATYVDSGKFFVVRTLLGVSDTDSIAVTVHYKPVITASNNSPLCLGIIDTLELYSTPGMPGMTYNWVGPNAFISTLQNPTITVPIGPTTFVGNYTVIATTTFGCKDTAVTYADTITRPLPPTITGPNYCQGELFVPYTITGLAPGGFVQWYAGMTGGIPSLTPVTPVNTSVPGLYKNYFTQKSGSCESIRDTITIRVITTPAAPIVTGPNEYCQFIGPILPLTVTPTTSSAAIKWYTTATGGTGVSVEPLPNVNVPGVYNYWVSQLDSTCEGPRTHVTITVHPKPSPPIVTPTPACQFWIPGQLSATPSGAGDVLHWYGPGVTPVGTTTAPTPSTTSAPDTVRYYVTEETIYGCISDSAIDDQITKIKPQVPVTGNTKYCQKANSALLNELVDSALNSHLNWYYNANPLAPTPRPFTDTIPGFYTWWVSQTIDGCEGDSAAVRVEIVYKPKFSIAVSNSWVCQHDSLRLAYKGPALFAPEYTWTLPMGAKAVNFTDIKDSMITVRFDSANQNTFVVTLRASIDSGFCYSDTTTNIKVIPQPTMQSFTKPDVCLGDTVQLSLIARSPNAYTYSWFVDNVLMTNSTALNIISANSHSGGPFTISWADSGRHVITVSTVTQEGCKSAPNFDSIYVHTAPDATFMVVSSKSTLCLEDSVEFKATSDNYNYSYTWQPTRYFDNINQPRIWGKMNDEHSIVTLTVTDPYGCYATQSLEVQTATCCLLAFPNAFTPNGDGINNVFRPYYDGYHRFHVFRIENRWGQTIFQAANSSDARWDGNYNGVPQDMGVYYYYIRYDCGGKTMEQKGDVTLIR